MRPWIFIGLFAMLTLAGCTTMTPAERRALDEEQCRSYGFRPNTDSFAECLQRIELDRRAERRAQMLRMDQWNDPIVIAPLLLNGTGDVSRWRSYFTGKLPFPR